MRYHFNVIDGIDVCDYLGTMLANESEARMYADIMKAHLARAKRAEKHQKVIRVTDGKGAELFRVAVPFGTAGNASPVIQPKN